jgi:hypothetical protein
MLLSKATPPRQQRRSIVARPEPAKAGGAAALQRNALAPGILAALVLFVGMALLTTEFFTPVRYVVTILALIVAWFAVQARHWWWVPVFLAIAVLWNPIMLIPIEGVPWVVAQPVAAAAFLAAGLLISVPRIDDTAAR